MSAIPSWLSFTVLAAIVAIVRLAAHMLWPRSSAAQPAAAPARNGSGLFLWIAVVCALAFVALTTALLTGAAITTLDTWVRGSVGLLHDHAFVQAGVFITSFGDAETLIAVTVVSAGWLWAGGRHHVTRGLLVSALGSQLTTYTLKYTIGRERPDFEVFASAVTPSFPSAHATGAVAVYGFITFALARELPSRARFEVMFWGSSFIALLAASRVILGVHFLSDVVGGLLVGMFWLVAGRAVARYCCSRTGV